MSTALSPAGLTVLTNAFMILEKVGGGFYDSSNRAQRSLILEEDVAHLQAQGQLAVHFGHVNNHSVSPSPTKT